MRINILIGGSAGQGINKVSEIISKAATKHGYFTFNYRDYQSLIRGGHNFNILSLSDKKIGSIESKIDCIISLDEKTLAIHEKKLKKENFKIGFEKFEKYGRNSNLAQAGAIARLIGIEKRDLIEIVKKEFRNNEAIKAAKEGYESNNEFFKLKKINRKLETMTGNVAISKGAINSKIQLYISYPMTPSTGVLHELANISLKEELKVFQPESEIAAINQALGASFSGKRTMAGTSGGGFDLMGEGLSFQGASEIPLVVYLASRPGPGTGVPTYSMQSDLDMALRAGHGEFPRIVIAPGDPNECIEKTNEAFYLSEKFNALSILISDKNLAEGEFSINKKINKILQIKTNRKIPGNSIVKYSSYEHDKFGNTTESEEITRNNAKERMRKYEEIKKECKKFEMVKIHGNSKAKNLIIGWGSTKGPILDAIEEINNSKKESYKFLQVLYLKPLSNKIKTEMEKTIKNGGNIILIEENVTGQLGRLIREKTGIAIKHKILKYDGRPFFSDKLKEEILKIK